MDLKHIEAPPTEAERDAIDAVLGPVHDDAPPGLREIRARRHLLLPVLHAIQGRVGWVSKGALGYACRRLDVPPAEAYGVASFYALFALTERAPVAAHLCDDIACKMFGADARREEIEQTIGAEGAAVKLGDGEVTWHRSPCLGLCEHAPAAMLTVAGAKPFERGFGPATAAQVKDALLRRRVADPSRTVLPQAGDPGLRLLERVGKVDPASLDDYRAQGGYAALRRALDQGPTWVIREVSESGLLGRGGAAFPTGRKWDAVSKAATRPRYVVCNADESEPGTFKDRYLMEDDPYAVVEAMTIAGFAVGAEQGYVYVRAEYPLAAERLEHAIAQARGRGLLGDDVMGRGVCFELEVRRGAGAYICGEETALFNSLEGFRGEPRAKPPFPVEAGLFHKPTVVNNVETLANVPWIVREGAQAYKSVGTASSPGTRLFCLAGAVVTPGLYEVPMGMTLDALLSRAGGVTPGRTVQAVLLGGAAGMFVGPGELGIPLTFEDTRKAGVTLGSGVVLVVDDTVKMVPLLARIAEFFRDESCGQCVPCRVGTVRQEELLSRLARGAPLGSVKKELVVLQELGQAMRDASICGLGHTASTAIESAVAKLKLFPGGPS